MPRPIPFPIAPNPPTTDAAVSLNQLNGVYTVSSRRGTAQGSSQPTRSSQSPQSGDIATLGSGDNAARRKKKNLAPVPPTVIGMYVRYLHHNKYTRVCIPSTISILVSASPVHVLNNVANLGELKPETDSASAM